MVQAQAELEKIWGEENCEVVSDEDEESIFKQVKESLSAHTFRNLDQVYAPSSPSKPQVSTTKMMPRR